MAFFRIEGTIISTTQAELLETMNWFATNYSGKIELANATGAQLLFMFGIKMDTYAEATAALTDLQTEYGARIQENWSMILIPS